MHPLKFFDPRDEATGFLSNFYRAEFHLDSHCWPTVEHYYQAQKFVDAAYAERIRLAPTPRAAKTLGRTQDVPLKADWESLKMTVMLRAVVAKFTQNNDLQAMLLQTRGFMLIEGSPTDSFWGDGLNHQGENRLGCLLTTLRDQIALEIAKGDQENSQPKSDPTQLPAMCFDAVRTVHAAWWAVTDPPLP